jgi:hypothetical protein
MTKVITRYFESAAQAQEVKKSLLADRLPEGILRVFTDATGLADALTAQNVDAATAGIYQQRVAAGGAVVMVKAGYKPLGVARIARDTMAAMGAMDLGDQTEEVSVKDKPAHMSSILDDHPLMLSGRKDLSRTNYYMADWPIPLISRRVPNPEMLIPRHGRMAAFPIPLISKRKPSDSFAFPRHARMANFPIPLISKRKPSDKFAFPRHARMANFPIPLLSRRKPFTGSVIARHARMANWPFPHLINGKTGTNALMPGGPRMANFPISLLSKRTPSDKFAFPRHARMANFPISLLSRRKPFTGSIFPRHARMADAILPLVVRRSTATPRSDQGFSLSRMLGLPTLLRR